MGIACIRDALTFDRNAHDLDVHTCVSSTIFQFHDVCKEDEEVSTCEFL